MNYGFITSDGIPGNSTRRMGLIAGLAIKQEANFKKGLAEHLLPLTK